MSLRYLEHRITPFEALGLKPLGRGLRQCWQAIRGDESSPGTRMGISSLRMLWPVRGPLTWLGVSPRKTIILNYFNRNSDLESTRQGFDTRVTYAKDLWGGNHTYNSHFGTDFVVPVGTQVLAPAAGTVVRVENLMHRGGLKVVIDHGDSIMTLYNHLARVLVSPGDTLQAGDSFALSGMSSVDGLVFFPWLAPHVHFTAFVSGWPVDPFAKDNEVALWSDGNQPLPTAGKPPVLSATQWDESAIADMFASCSDPEITAEYERAQSKQERGTLATYWRYFAYPKFSRHPELTTKDYQRQAILGLPFSGQEVSGVTHCYPNERSQ